LALELGARPSDRRGMIEILAHRTYRRLFAAQVVALMGTGLATVALGLLAYQIAPEQAGAVLGTALAIKMIAYVGVAPLAQAFADRLPRRAFLISMDLVRATVAMFLPWVSEIWQVYVLIFVLQSCSAAFTPTFQATIPDVLPEERDYTKALSLARLAYDLESLLSPAFAAALLTLIGFHWLFAGTAIGFVGSACLILTVLLPHPTPAAKRAGIYDRITRGTRIYLKTPRLRGLLAFNLAAAAASAMVIVNTVVYVRGELGRSEADVGVTLAAFGAGSMLVALILPRLLDRIPDRRVMIAGAAVLSAGMATMTLIATAGLGNAALWQALLAIWVVLGMGYSMVQTPGGRLLRRSAHAPDRPALFAAQFALSHACWLITYPLAGWLGAQVGMAATLLVLAVVTALGAIAAPRLWPAPDQEVVAHVHDDLQADHPHVHDAESAPGGYRHAHAFVIDEHHRRWPA
jgi:H+ antiporter protein